MKKFEIYQDNKKIGILNFNEKLMKKVLDSSVTSVITAVTCEGCNFFPQKEEE